MRYRFRFCCLKCADGKAREFTATTRRAAIAVAERHVPAGLDPASFVNRQRFDADRGAWVRDEPAGPRIASFAPRG